MIDELKVQGTQQVTMMVYSANIPIATYAYKRRST
jgi:hypothetical protein